MKASRRTGEATRRGAGARAVVDTVGPATFDESLRSLGREGMGGGPAVGGTALKDAKKRVEAAKSGGIVSPAIAIPRYVDPQIT